MLAARAVQSLAFPRIARALLSTDEHGSEAGLQQRQALRRFTATLVLLGAAAALSTFASPTSWPGWVAAVILTFPAAMAVAFLTGLDRGSRQTLRKRVSALSG
jgi:peptidoglycan/LPS O-acetylase OafA/YrhL